MVVPSLRARRLARGFYDRDTIVVARQLLGKYLVHVVAGVERVGRIVETEAYLGPHDLRRTSRGLTERAGDVRPPGHAYVMIYGMHWCRIGHAGRTRLRGAAPRLSRCATSRGARRAPRCSVRRWVGAARTGTTCSAIDPFIAEAEGPPPARIARRADRRRLRRALARRLLRYISGNAFVSRNERIRAMNRIICLRGPRAAACICQRPFLIRLHRVRATGTLRAVVNYGNLAIAQKDRQAAIAR